MAKQLNNGDPENRIKFKFYSWDSSGSHKPYGELTTTAKELESNEVNFNLKKASINKMF